jgi:hypothetical protein
MLFDHPKTKVFDVHVRAQTVPLSPLFVPVPASGGWQSHAQYDELSPSAVPPGTVAPGPYVDGLDMALPSFLGRNFFWHLPEPLILRSSCPGAMRRDCSAGCENLTLVPTRECFQKCEAPAVWQPNEGPGVEGLQAASVMPVGSP